ncbi:unnamed protein product [Arctogadus glacialis]
MDTLWRTVACTVMVAVVIAGESESHKAEESARSQGAANQVPDWHLIGSTCEHGPYYCKYSYSQGPGASISTVCCLMAGLRGREGARLDLVFNIISALIGSTLRPGLIHVDVTFSQRKIRSKRRHSGVPVLGKSLSHYDVAIPVRVNPGGGWRPGEAAPPQRPPHQPRTKRSPHPQPDSLFYQLTTPRSTLLLNLTLQGGLLSRQFRVEYWRRGRLAWSRPYAPQCLYVGHLQDRPHSSQVALSTCNGLSPLRAGGSAGSVILTALPL